MSGSGNTECPKCNETLEVPMSEENFGKIINVHCTGCGNIFSTKINEFEIEGSIKNCGLPENIANLFDGISKTIKRNKRIKSMTDELKELGFGVQFSLTLGKLKPEEKNDGESKSLEPFDETKFLKNAGIRLDD